MHRGMLNFIGHCRVLKHELSAPILLKEKGQRNESIENNRNATFFDATMSAFNTQPQRQTKHSLMPHALQTNETRWRIAFISHLFNLFEIAYTYECICPFLEQLKVGIGVIWKCFNIST